MSQSTLEQDLLPEEHITVGTFIWYKAESVILKWSFPAIISQVNLENRTFKIRPLAGGIKEFQELGFGILPKNCDTCSMRRIDKTEAAKFMVDYQEGLHDLLRDHQKCVSGIEQELKDTEVLRKEFNI